MKIPNLMDSENVRKALEPLLRAATNPKSPTILMKVEFTSPTGGLIAFEMKDYKKWKRTVTNMPRTTDAKSGGQ